MQVEGGETVEPARAYLSPCLRQGQRTHPLLLLQALPKREMAMRLVGSGQVERRMRVHEPMLPL